MTSKSVLRSLQITFGRIPEIIEKHLKYLCYNDTHKYFTCVPCGKIIIVNLSLEKTTKNFENHLLTNAHTSITTTDEDLRRNLNQTFRYRIPQFVENNFKFLGMNGQNYECVICKTVITVSNDETVTENNFSYHLLSFAHEDNLEICRDTLSELHEIYGGIPALVLNHSQFLTKYENHYLCTICQKHIQVHPSIVLETEKIFESHLHCLKHIRNAKQTRAFSLLPELRKIFSPLPNYMMRNVEYISVNGPNFFCSLCNENIKYNRRDLGETRQNFKLHNLSSTHEECMGNRRNSDNHVFKRLKSLFETFPDTVLEEVKYIGINANDYYCNICKVTIIDDGNDYQTKINVISHFDSVYHRLSVILAVTQKLIVSIDLTQLFGGLPDLIAYNINYIKFVEDNIFECVLCDHKMEAKNSDNYKNNFFVTKHTFEKHFKSIDHLAGLEVLEEQGKNVLAELKRLFSPIPQFIWNNRHYIGFVDDDDSDDFECWVCDKTIVVLNGPKKEELTWQNFKNHFLSVGHMAKLKHKAHLKMEATEKLELVFHSIPRFILSNIEHLQEGDNIFLCTLCDVHMPRGRLKSTLKRFRDHLYGARHKKNLKKLEDKSDKALKRLDTNFGRLPEFLLTNIDFLRTNNEDLFCLLCEETLPINDDLVETKRSLRSHMGSTKHQKNLSSL